MENLGIAPSGAGTEKERDSAKADMYVLVLGYGERGRILRACGDPCGVMANAIERGDMSDRI